MAWAALLPSVALLALFWLLIFNQQRLEWTVNVVYSYGWAVPFLAGYLLWERWVCRPARQRPLPGGLVLTVGLVLLLAYLPVRVVQEANPDWVKVNWLMTALCAGLSLLAIAATGGWRYAGHFFFPLLFCFSALPWPVWMETYLVQELMRGNAAICAEVLTWGGIPAMAEGNLIQVANQWLNVEEACSGIRSLQTAFMVSLFLGELHRLSVRWRLGLMLASFGTAFGFNLLRTLVLAGLTARGASVEQWHDTVGVVTMVVTLLALWGISEWIKARTATAAVAPRSVAPAADLGRRPWPAWFAVAGCGWLLAAEWLTGYWYRSHETRVPPPLPWFVAWPVQAPKYVEVEFAERTLALLKFNAGRSAEWQADEGYPWQMYVLDWAPGRVSKFLSRSHYPTVCLPATGLKLVRELEPWDCEVRGIRLPFATYLFADGDRSVYVFHAIMEDRPLRPGGHLAYRQVAAAERLSSVWQGERNLGQHVIGIALRGASSAEEAREIAARELQKLIQTGTAHPGRILASAP